MPICAPELVEGHPEVPLVAPPGLVHLRVAGFLLVLGRGRGGDDGGVDNGTLPHQQAALFQHHPDLLKQRPRQLGPLKPVAELQQRRCVGHRVAVQVDTGKAAQSLAVIQRILQRFVGQPVRTTAVQRRSAASAPARLAANRARLWDKAAADAPPAEPTARPHPSQPKTCRAASASSSRRIPPAKSCPDATSPSLTDSGILTHPSTQTRAFLQCSHSSGY